MPQHMAAPDGSELPLFYKLLRQKLAQRGAEVRIVVRAAEWQTTGLPPGDFHFVHQGRAQGPRVLNCAVAYLNPFFYADPQGIYFESTNTTARFDAAGIPADRAAAFFDTLVADHVTPRRSRYSQPPEVQTFPPGAIAVFLQDWSLPVERARHMEAQAMLTTVLAHRAGRPVIVKPHPRNQGLETLDLLALLRGHPDVIVTEANLHDILRQAAVSVSISSSVAVEGMLHRVPAVLFGRSDLHFCAQTVRVPGDWPAALTRALATDWPFEPFLFWLLHRRSVRTGPGMMGPILKRMQAAQADFAALGLATP